MRHGELVTIAEASEILRLKPSTIRAWVLRRRIAFVKLGRRVMFRRTELEALIAQSVVPAHAEYSIEIKRKPKVNTNADKSPQFLPQL